MKSIAIQQTLHGYSDGHRLLGGCVNFSDDLARIVLRMSDLSGSHVVPGFEEYLTGYPLEPMNMYALAKTWYASEMPRPGCVWTHTLFIPGNCMADIPDLQALKALFVRPQETKGYAEYSKTIQFEIEPHEPEVLGANEGTFDQVKDLIDALYRKDLNNVLVGTQNSRSYEVALFRVWSQQWPSLRNCFAFSTGALSARGVNGKPFDIQCSPNSLIREIIATSVSKQSKEMNLLAKADQQQPSWFAIAARDAFDSNGSLFRRLLWAFAEEPNRMFYVRYAQLIEKSLNSTPCSVEEMIAVVAEIFPMAETGRGLKFALFGGAGGIPGFQQFDEGEVLAALACSPHYEAFDSKALLLKIRGTRLCNENVASARKTISKLFHSSINRLGEEVLAGMIEAITPVMARAVVSEQSQFLPTLFQAKPELGLSAELWLSANNRKRELLEVLLSHQQLDESLIRGIAVALLEGDSEFLLKRALETWGKPFVFGVFDWLAKGNGPLSERSLGALTFHVESIVQWVLDRKDTPQDVVISAAHIIAPFTYQFRQFDSNVWLNAFRNLRKDGNQREANYFATMLLALGFQNATPEPLVLVEECFEQIHQLAWDDLMPDDMWFILDPIVPHLWWHRDWDKCERLRRGLIEAFVKYHWPAPKLADCIKNDRFLTRVVDSARHVEGGKELISQASRHGQI